MTELLLLSMILTHPEFESSKQIPIKIDSAITGRVCMTSYLHGLYIIKQIMGESCKTYLEIGTLFGGSIAMLMQSDYETTFVGIDLFRYYGLDIDPNTGVEVSKDTAGMNIHKHNIYDDSYYLIEGDSHDPSFIRLAKALLPKVDLLFIDGDHSKKGVIADFNNYSPLVSKGGVIVFDNYGDPNWKGVKKAVDKLDLSTWHKVGQYGYSYIIQRVL